MAEGDSTVETAENTAKVGGKKYYRYRSVLRKDSTDLIRKMRELGYFTHLTSEGQGGASRTIIWTRPSPWGLRRE